MVLGRRKVVEEVNEVVYNMIVVTCMHSRIASTIDGQAGSMAVP